MGIAGVSPCHPGILTAYPLGTRPPLAGGYGFLWARGSHCACLDSFSQCEASVEILQPMAHISHWGTDLGNFIWYAITLNKPLSDSLAALVSGRPSLSVYWGQQ